MSNEMWERLYLEAVMEVDKAKMPQRLFLARQVIEDRLRELKQSRDHRAEKNNMESVLKRLDVLENESQAW